MKVIFEIKIGKKKPEKGLLLIDVRLLRDMILSPKF